MGNFWKNISKSAQEKGRPITVLAPMEDVTDTVFRQIVMSQGRPDVFVTEFTNCDGICSPKGRAHVIHRFEYLPAEKPIIAQVWGKTPESYYESVKLVIELGFNGVDVNMGCPAPNVIKNNAGGGMIRQPQLALEVIDAVNRAITDFAKNDDFAFSIKTRLGFSEITLSWLDFLLKQKIDALTIHLRTVAEMSKVPAHWELASEIVRMRDEVAPNTILIGNGDITTKQQIYDVSDKYKFDGAMVGRGIFENLWIFSEQREDHEVLPKERLALLLRHLQHYDEKWGRRKNFEMMKKFFKVYLKGYPGAKQLRDELNLMKNVHEMVTRITHEIDKIDL